jgi:MMP 1-O-methyltransferase
MTPAERERRTAELVALARAARGFMPDDEGQALMEAARRAGEAFEGPGSPGQPLFVEIGAWCGKSSVYIGAAAEASGAVLYSLDHHHGSEENQAGWEHHDETLVDRATGRMDTLPFWRRAIEAARAEDLAIAVVGDSPTVAARWNVVAGLVFIDGGHGEDPAWADYHGWAPRVGDGGWLAIHDVFPDPADGGRPPFEIFTSALETGDFVEERSFGTGSLRVLRRSGP